MPKTRSSMMNVRKKGNLRKTQTLDLPHRRTSSGVSHGMIAQPSRKSLATGGLNKSDPQIFARKSLAMINRPSSD